MANNDARPYLCPLEGTFVWGPWHVRQGEDWVVLEERIEGWDPGIDLELRRSLQVDLASFELQTSIHPKYFGINTSWRSSTTGMVGSGSPAPLPESGKCHISVQLAGARIGGTLSIRTTVVLLECPETRSPGTVHIPGSVVADHQQDLILELAAAMYPVNMIDFAQTRYSPTASWHLETGADQLDAPFLGAFMLLINSRDVALCEAIARGPKDKANQALYDELEAGVASVMIELAVHEHDQLVEGDWPAGSVGAILRRTLERSGLVDAVAPSSYDLAEFRTRLAGAVRNAGQGRLFR